MVVHHPYYGDGSVIYISEADGARLVSFKTYGKPQWFSEKDFYSEFDWGEES